MEPWSLASAADSGNPHEPIAATGYPLSLWERVRVRASSSFWVIRPPSSPTLLPQGEKGAKKTRQHRREPEREASCLPLFCLQHSTTAARADLPAPSLNPLFLKSFLLTSSFLFSRCPGSLCTDCCRTRCLCPHLVRYQLYLPRCLSHSSFHCSIAAYLAKVI